MTPRKTLRIARWEATSAAGQYDRRTLALIGVTVVVVVALTPFVASKGIALDTGIYRVGVDHDSPYYEPIAADSSFVAVAPNQEAFVDGEVDLLIDGDRVYVQDSRQGRAAAAALDAAIEAYNDRVMRQESNRAAAFPVTVELRYVDRDLVTVISSNAGDASNADTGITGGAAEADDGATGETTTETGTGSAQRTERDTGTGGGLPSIGGSQLFQGRTDGTPSEIAPPFPFGSLVLAFLFLVPMNFVVQAYASSVLRERLNRRGESLLVAPVSRGDIVGGKTLPYFVVMMSIAAVVAATIGGGLPAVTAVAPVALVFLSTTFVGAMLARSFKELTFVTVAISVVLTAYVFVPAIFTNVHPIASISPLTLVVRQLEGIGVGPAEYAFSTLPLYLASGVLFVLGAGLYREEDLFTQRSLGQKATDAVAVRIRGRTSAAVLSAFSIPFVLFAELFAIALLFALPIRVSLPLLLIAVAAIEEVAKSVHVYAGFVRGRYDRDLRTATTVGVLSGLGFFLGEKLAVVTQIVGLPELSLGQAAFSGAGIGLTTSPVVVVGLLLAPLGLHAVTASITAIGASRTSRHYVVAFAVAVAVHTMYNLAVVSALG